VTSPTQSLEVTIFAAALELCDPVAAADRVHDRRTALFARVVDDDVEGWGECPLDDASPDAVLAVLAGLPATSLAAGLRDARHDRTEPRRRSSEFAADAAHQAARRLLSATALDTALRRVDISFAEELGVADTDVGFAGVVGIEDPARARDRAEALVALGATRLRVKVSPAAGSAAVRAVLDAVAVPVVADANGSFDPSDASALRALTSLPLAWLEQPFAVGSLQQLARLARSSEVRIGLDESVRSLDALRVIAAADAASVVCIKPSRLGVLGALDALRETRVLRLASYVGGYFEAGLGRAVLGPLAALGDYDGDVLAPSTYLRADPCHLDPPRDARQPLYRGPGLGPPPDLDALEVRLERTIRP
jgi:L-alanine-DL-glutamate epimerase-like enolase superfamily enzyme